MSIYVSLIEVMKNIEQPVKGTNAYNYKYTTLEHVVMAIKQAMVYTVNVID